MEHISANKADFAKLPLKLDLQWFADEITEVIDEVIEEPAEVIEQEVEEPTEPDEGVKEPEIAKQEPERDLEKDAAFAEIRRKAEAAERRASELEQQRQKDMEIARKYGAYGVFSDTDVSAKYGQSNGIHTLEQLDREIQRQELLSKGMDPDVVNQYIDQAVKNHPDMVAARQAKETADRIAFENHLVSSYNSLQADFPDLVKQPTDISDEVWKRWNNGSTGLSLSDAYTLVNRKEILTKQQAATKQAALNQLNSKNHMKKNDGGGAEVEVDAVPDDVMREYLKMFDSELRKGKITKAQLIADYKKNNKK